MRDHIAIKMINNSGLPKPEFKTEHSAGMDLRSASHETIVLKPGESLFVANNAISFEYQGDALLARAFN